MVERDDPLVAALAHQPRIDAVLRVLRTIELVTADELRGVGREHLDLNVEEAQASARRFGGAIVADVMIERVLPVLLELAARYEDHVGRLDIMTVAASTTRRRRGFRFMW